MSYKIKATDKALANSLAKAFNSAIRNAGSESKVTVRTLDDLLVSLNTLKKSIDSFGVGIDVGQVEVHGVVELVNGSCVSVRMQR